jgi:hypothetical protein
MMDTPVTGLTLTFPSPFCELRGYDRVWQSKTGPLTLAGELEMSEVDRQRVAQIYGGKDWRALAKGQSGHWYALGGQATETAAVDAQNLPRRRA